MSAATADTRRAMTQPGVDALAEALAAAGFTTSGAPLVDPLIDLKQVEKIVGLTKSPIYARIAASTFPAPLRLSSRASRWRLSSVVRWVEQQTSELPAKGTAK